MVSDASSAAPDDSGFPQFAVALGEEGSDPWVEHEGRLVRVDQFAMSGHVERVDEDLAAVAGLGVDVWRYGYPWRLTEREPGTYDWSGWDELFAACERHGLRPVVDLCHFGLPDHLPGMFFRRSDRFSGGLAVGAGDGGSGFLFTAGWVLAPIAISDMPGENQR